MTLPDVDLFEFWRLALGIICTIYAIVVTVHSLWQWVIYLSGSGKTTAIMRTYVIVSLMRLSPRRFSSELIQMAFWLTMLVLFLWLHRFFQV